MDNTDLVKYQGSQFLFDNTTYKEECLIDPDFQVCMDFVNESAKTRGIQIYIVSHFRRVDAIVHGAVVKPATRGNHFIGQAIDFKLLFRGKIYDHDNLDRENLKNLPPEIKDFLLEIDVHPILRWGGLFRTADNIHIDSGLNLTNPELYSQKFKLYQNDNHSCNP